ncbi:hypothetical protein ACWFNE_20215 [Cellulomonas sp. NPDC055163]
MQLLYAVEFDVACPPERVPGDVLREHLAKWLSNRAAEEVTADDLLADGVSWMGPAPDGRERAVQWSALGKEPRRATRVEVRQVSNDVTFVTRVTIGEIDGRTTLRVSMGRETSSVWLTPVAASQLRQPALVAQVASDADLELRVSGQRQSTRYERAANEAAAEEVARALKISTRLPVALLHARAPGDWATARSLANGLVGLATVVTLSRLAADVVRREFPAVSLPYGGGALVWSDPGARPLIFSPAQLAMLAPHGLRDQLFRQLGELSVYGRGTDMAYRDARASAQAGARARAAERITAAAVAQDFQGQVHELSAELARERTDREFWESEATTLQEQVNQLAAAASQAEYWREQYETVRAATLEVDQWQHVPLLQPKLAGPTFDALEKASSGRIVFTSEAEKSWRKSGYPRPEAMTEQLITLGRAAGRLYEEPPSPMPRLDSWFKVEFGLNVSTNDDTIEKDKRLRYFWFDDQQHDQVPHVKVDDHVKPNEVGRIHFALDSDEGRFIVNHVGLKLYGT